MTEKLTLEEKYIPRVLIINEKPSLLYYLKIKKKLKKNSETHYANNIYIDISKRSTIPFTNLQCTALYSPLAEPSPQSGRGPTKLGGLSVSRSSRVTEHRRHLEGRTLERRLGTRDVASGGWHGICKTPFVTRSHKNPSNAALDWQPCATGTPCLPVVGNYALQNRDTTSPTLRPLPTLLGEAARRTITRTSPTGKADFQGGFRWIFGK